MNKYQKEVIQTQLNNEKDIIKELQETYEKALEDVNEKIRELSARTDLENLQTIIYQTQYQKALKAQIEGRLDQLHADEFGSISKYLGEAYNVGFVGVAYDIANQGIPILMPIDEEAVKKALTVDSKLSSTLYNSLGENVSDLKTAIRQELSRGIVEGKTWNQIAMSIAGNMKNSPFQKAVNNSIRIARTEGHRVSIQGAIDAQYKAKESGADIVKQWDATLDLRTRQTHRELDGQIREIDEDFIVYSTGAKTEAPGMFGVPAEDINCRCGLLQRARWALDEKELETLRDRAEQLELYVPKDKRETYREAKEQNFERYKEKYLNIANKIVKDDELAKASLRYLNHNDKLYDYAKNIIPEDNYEDIVSHGDPYSLVFRDANGKEVNVSADEFCKILEKDPNYKGGNIRLIACEAAADDGVIPQYIADYFGVDVKAPTEVVNVDQDGKMILANSEIDAKMGIETGEWKIYHPNSERK